MEKKSKKSIIIGITGLLLVTLTLLGLTYAYYRTRIIGNEADTSVSVTSQKLEVTYQNESALVSVTGLEPGGDAIVKTFEVANTGNATATYSVWLEDMINTFERNQDLQYALTKNGESVTGTIDHIAAGTHQILIPSVSIDADATDSYTLTINYKNEEDIDQSEDMGSTLQFKINIGEEAVTWENPAAPSWAAEGTTTLISAIKTNNTASNLTTIPGQEVSGASEQGIGSTQDDYGTSYYFRGKVENNYVTYSGMCWRIVRVQGDGSIKLALADGAHPCGTANGYSATDTDSAFVADAEGNAMRMAYKECDGICQDVTDFLFANSDIPLVLSTWAENNNLDMSQLVEAEWCNDTANTENIYSAAPEIIVPPGSSSIDPSLTFYIHGAYGRLSSIETAEPTLKCNSKGIEGSTGIEAKATRYKNVLGILSADEEAFAGGTYYIDYQELNHYLTTNAEGTWLTLSPATFMAINDYTEGQVGVFTVDASGLFNEDHVSNHSNYVRPAVVLRSDVRIQDGGNGTIDAPYVIK